MNIGFFITSHGFGHAARSCAIIEKLAKDSGKRFFLFSTAPKWFFDNSLQTPFRYFFIQTDVGLVQDDPFNENLNHTLSSLEKYYPFSPELISSTEKILKENQIDLIICDISAFGIFMAKRLNIDSILIENFTWDWIYSFYSDGYPQIKNYVEYLAEIYNSATIRILCEPYCSYRNQDYTVPPVFREARLSPEEVLKKLGFKQDDRLVLVSMGGIPIEKFDQNLSYRIEKLKFIIPVDGVSQSHQEGNLVYLPHNHNFFHPDLVRAAKIVVGKVGYSTIAEVYSLQKPFVYVRRDNFPESPFLEKFILEHLNAYSSAMEEFFTHDWLEQLFNLISLTPKPDKIENGAKQIAEIIKENY